ncbi:DUF5681 domain-containing protein [Plasticicumulans sp.]|uniref:DUF5681 domain-containing protein n=1 Tax=Plasticicumulans sp. TaxID=2307179 RepID=UPI0039283934
MTFRKGQSGNPKGRPPGRKTTAQALRERINERAGEVLQTVIDAALAGNLLAAQLVLSRVIPPARGQAVPGRTARARRGRHGHDREGGCRARRRGRRRGLPRTWARN